MCCLRRVYGRIMECVQETCTEMGWAKRAVSGWAMKIGLEGNMNKQSKWGSLPPWYVIKHRHTCEVSTAHARGHRNFLGNTCTGLLVSCPPPPLQFLAKPHLMQWKQQYYIHSICSTYWCPQTLANSREASAKYKWFYGIMTPCRVPLPWGWSVANCVLFKRVQRELGFQRCKIFAVGGAITRTEVYHYLMSLNIPVMDFYGMWYNVKCLNLRRLWCIVYV